MSAEDADLCELYAEAFGIRGKRKWSEPFIRDLYDKVRRSDEEKLALKERVEDVRTKLMERTALIPEDHGKGVIVREISQALRNLMAHDETGTRLSEMAARFEEQGDLQTASEYRQIEDKIGRLLDNIDALLGDETMRLGEYAEVLDAGFSEITVATIPLGIDRVITGDLTRSRLGEVRLLYLTGASDAAIPSGQSAGGLLTQIDRAFLAETVPEVTFAPSVSELAAQQRFYLYLCLTRPSEVLTVSFATLLPSGEGGRASVLVEKILAMFGREAPEKPEKDPLCTQAESRADMEKRMAGLIRKYADGFMPEADEEAFLAIYDALPKETKKKLTDAAFFEYREKKLPKDLTGMLYGDTIHTSVSRLELFASCAYAHFLSYGLKVRKRLSASFDRMDLGIVYHAVLEQFASRLQDEGIGWNEVTDPQIEGFLEDAIHAYTAQYGGAKLYESARDLHTIHRMGRILTRTVKTLCYQLSRGSFTPGQAEYGFEYPVRDGDTKLVLHGQIDRIDLARDNDTTYIKVIDYKSGSRDFDAGAFYHGLQLQLVTYMDAALHADVTGTRDTEKIPAALLYYRISDPVIDEKDLKGTGDPSEEAESAVRKKLCATGLVNGDGRVLDLLDAGMDKKSDVIPVGFKTDGSFTAASNVFMKEDYETITAHAGHLMGDMARRILDGEIAVRPYETGDKGACTWCDYHHICGFDPRMKGYDMRTFKDMTMEEALTAMRGAAKEDKT